MRTGYLEDKLRLKDVWSRPSDCVAPTRHGGVVLHGGARFQVVAEVPAKAELFKSLQLCVKTSRHQWLVLVTRFLNTVSLLVAVNKIHSDKVWRKYIIIAYSQFYTVIVAETLGYAGEVSQNSLM